MTREEYAQLVGAIVKERDAEKRAALVAELNAVIAAQPKRNPEEGKPVGR